MGLRFGKSFKLGKFVRLNLSKSGVGASIGVLGLAFMVVACRTEDSSGEDKAPPTPTVDAAAALEPEVLVADAGITPLENRVAFALWRGWQREPAAQDVQVRWREGERLIWESAPAVYADHDGDYYVVYPPFTAAGDLTLEVTYTDSAKQSQTLPLAVRVQSAPAGITIGMAAPRSQTAVWDGQGAPGTISSLSDPNPAFYGQTIAEAISSGQPTVILFATPALCSRKICAPVWDSFSDLWEVYGDRVNFVHHEAIDLSSGDWLPVIQAWGLTEQPWVYIIDAEGQVARRYDAMISVEEAALLLDLLLAG